MTIDEEIIAKSDATLQEIAAAWVHGEHGEGYIGMYRALAAAYGKGAGMYLEAIGIRIAERLAEIESRGYDPLLQWSINTIRAQEKDYAAINELKRVLNLMGIDKPTERV